MPTEALLEKIKFLEQEKTEFLKSRKGKINWIFDNFWPRDLQCKEISPKT